jgi:hypothetical protein
MASTQNAVGRLENEVLFVVLQGIAVRYRHHHRLLPQRGKIAPHIFLSFFALAKGFAID